MRGVRLVFDTVGVTSLKVTPGARESRDVEGESKS